MEVGLKAKIFFFNIGLDGVCVGSWGKEKQLNKNFTQKVLKQNRLIFCCHVTTPQHILLKCLMVGMKLATV